MPEPDLGQSAQQSDSRRRRNSVRLLLIVGGGTAAADILSKGIVERQLRLYEQILLIGDYLRLTFIHNPGAAFGISVGEHSRVIFLVLSVVALVALLAMYRSTAPGDRVRLFALSLITGGALGNVWNRVANPAGVVDWIDVGVGDLRWPVFNFADVAITIGAVVLALSLWREEDREEQRRDRAAAEGTRSSASERT